MTQHTNAALAETPKVTALRPVTIALAGNPNSGKTTTFNALTGARQHVGNYPGVTVEKKEGSTMLDGERVHVVDLPGTYSLTAYSVEELAARNFLVDERPDVVVDVLDAGTLERSLYLAVQFMEMGVPLVLALNMMDEVRKRNMSIDSCLLGKLLGVPVVETIAKAGKGKEALLSTAMMLSAERRGAWKPLEISYSPDLDEAIAEMVQLIEKDRFLVDQVPARWLAVKFLEQDDEVRNMARKVGPTADRLQTIADRVAEHCARTLKTHPESIIADYRYGYIASVMKQGVLTRDDSRDRIELSDRVDKVVTHALFGPLLMLGVLYFMFDLTFTVGEIPMGWLETFFGWLGDAATAAIPPGLFQSLVVSGIIDGVGGVIGFVPLIVMMFLILSFLDDLGYVARMAYMLDRVFKIFGLHGSSVMPFIISGGIPGGCAVPGVMAARTLRSPKERLATILVAPFMSCGAKIPVFLLLTAAFFPNIAGQLMFAITLTAWAVALIVARLLRSTVVSGPATPFIMELPPYRIPTLRGVLIHTWERAWMYIRKAGTVILAISILLWACMTFPSLPQDRLSVFETEHAAVEASIDAASEADRPALEDQLVQLEDREAQAALRYSVAGRIGTALESVTKVAGFDWRTNIALVGGFAAKEVIVSTLGTAYSLGDVDPEDSQPLSARLAADPGFSAAAALALIVFTMIYAPCMVTVAAIGKEAGWSWAAFSVIFNTVLGFSAATLTYHVARSFLG